MPGKRLGMTRQRQITHSAWFWSFSQIISKQDGVLISTIYDQCTVYKLATLVLRCDRCGITNVNSVLKRSKTNKQISKNKLAIFLNAKGAILTWKGCLSKSQYSSLRKNIHWCRSSTGIGCLFLDSSRNRQLEEARASLSENCSPQGEI